MGPRLICALVLLALPCAAQTTYELIEKKLGQGDVSAALREFTDKVVREVGGYAGPTRRLFSGARLFLERDEGGPSEEARRLCDRLLGVGESWLREKPDLVESRLWHAEARVVVAEWRRRVGDEGWADALRETVRELAEWHGGEPKRVRALVRAVEICGDAGLWDDAETLVKAIPATASSAPYAAYRLRRVRELVARGKRKEAVESLTTFFTQVRDALDGPEPDVALADVYNDAAEYAARHKELRVDLPFRLRTHKFLYLEVDVPVSHRWEVDGEEKGLTGKIRQWGRPGQLITEMQFFVTPPGLRYPDGTLRPKLPKQRLKRWEMWAAKPFPAEKRPRKRGGRLNRHFPKAAALTVEGTDELGRRVHRTAHTINARRTKDAQIAILETRIDRDTDPQADALLATVREDVPIPRH